MVDLSVKKIIEEYLKLFSGEKKTLKILRDQIKKDGETDIFSRKATPGHITASAVVLSRDLSKVLLINHVFLKKFIQPGGHVDASDLDIMSAAVRELKEEVGINNILPISVSKDCNVPFDIDIHSIPENSKKQECEHFHYDFRYLFFTHNDESIFEQLEEVHDAKWVDFENFAQIDDFSELAKKITVIIKKQKQNIFFETIIEEFLGSQEKKKLNFIVVSHIVKDVPDFLKSLSKVGEIKALIPKRNSIDQDIFLQLKQNYPIYDVGRDGVKKVEFLKKIFKEDNNFILFDIGGYFAQEKLSTYAKDKIVGIIEDTENGHQKYQICFREHSFPYQVISVARSSLKLNEDALVGYSIGFYTEFVLRKNRILPRYFNVGVIGYGKIGQGIVSYLLNQNIKPFVFDVNPIKMVRAYREGCLPVKYQEVLTRSDVIFCATGNKSIINEDFNKLKEGAFVASATSSDDEFGLQDKKLKWRNYKSHPIKDGVQKVETEKHFFYLINGGNSVNFITPGDRVGEMIRLVQAEQIACVGGLLNQLELVNDKEGIKKLPKKYRQIIAKIFLEKIIGIHMG